MSKIVLKVMVIFNRINLTQEEEECILHLLREAESDRQSPYSSAINSIFVKYWKKHNQIKALEYCEHWDDC